MDMSMQSTLQAREECDQLQTRLDK